MTHAIAGVAPDAQHAIANGDAVPAGEALGVDLLDADRHAEVAPAGHAEAPGVARIGPRDADSNGAHGAGQAASATEAGERREWPGDAGTVAGRQRAAEGSMRRAGAADWRGGRSAGLGGAKMPGAWRREAPGPAATDEE